MLAPNLTIYNKLIADFTPNTPKYVFKGIAEFATDAAGDHHRRQLRERQRPGTLFDELIALKIKSSTSRRSTPKSAAARRPGSSGSPSTSARATSIPGRLDDLVLLMDESHRYRASAGVQAINELKPILGLELTATPFVETGSGAVAVQERHLQLSPSPAPWTTAS